MIEKIIKEIGLEETWKNIEAQREGDYYIWCLWWGVQSVINDMLMKIAIGNFKEERLI